jgi:biopolymer transport protein ExbB
MKSKRRLCVAGIVLGSLLTLSPLLGLLGTCLGMMRAFNTLQGDGIHDPKALSGDIGTVLSFTTAGLLLFPVGIAILALSLVSYTRLRRDGRIPALPTEPGQHTAH